MDRARLAAFILLCVFALSLSGCVKGPGFGKAEPDQPPKEIKRPAANQTIEPEPVSPKEMQRPPATKTKPAKKPLPPEDDSSAPPAPTKPPAIGGSGG